MNLALLFCCVMMVGTASPAPQETAPAILVEDGVGRGTILLNNKASETVRRAARELQYHVTRASGAELRVSSGPETDGMPDGELVVRLGPSGGRGLPRIDAQKLPPAEYRIRCDGHYLIFAGNAEAVLYAVYDFLDEYLGARWLWPGELGTFVPVQRTIHVPAMDVTTRPDIERRQLRMPLGPHPPKDVSPLIADDQRRQLMEEAKTWLLRHKMGNRTPCEFGHSFTQWWDRYAQEHPDYFAVPPPGEQQPHPPADRVKLCVSNPAVAEQILTEWREDGSPSNWNVSPNDGSGFCTCERCRALDGIPGQSAEAIWHADGVNLTRRYVTLWNEVLRRMKASRPDATLSVCACSAYCDPPADLKLEEGIVVGFAHDYQAYDAWRGWRSAGARLLLRPNWWHIGAGAPHLPLFDEGNFLLFAEENGMIGFDFDSLLGYWGTQAPRYYVIARLAARPMSVLDAMTEFISAFGDACGLISRYLEYWQQYTQRCGYVSPAGGAVSPNPEGLFEKVCREHGWPRRDLGASWLALPYLYPDSVLDPAFALLDEADAKTTDDTVHARIQFLRDGLRHFKLTRDAIRLVYAKHLPDGFTKADVSKAIAALQDCRRELTPRHVVWGEIANWEEQRRGVRTVPETKAPANTEGR